MIDNDTLLDSPEGIAHLIAWARANDIVLNQRHIDIAIKHGVSVDGVLVARLLPLTPKAKSVHTAA